ncbi:hypothetical protein BJ684DRAFT_15650 [Piptocephalis cylindrospora]|uniref:SH3 domain-containing protein n=1 Tax=Piptocephalis cylindrospora TaxID=1907219 RepID=A0A4P9Y516_9FUNG|nr:hypothetical protein BJ684DRAFT_15650 [Piptocephalis cylindrospora]|eukprot:RKP14003.1 hypothetical protein BJ684DRAFT_15650 [Piptocephalis cylindrospora]
MRHNSCLTLLSAALVLATTGSAQSDSNWKNCRVPYEYKEVTYYGGTTDDNGSPWCVQIRPPPKQDWGMMDVSTVPSIPARTETGENSTCVTTGYPVTVTRKGVPVTFNVYGCYYTNQTQTQFPSAPICKTVSGAMGQCLGIVPTEIKKNANGDAKVVAGNEGSPADKVVDKVTGDDHDGDDSHGSSSPAVTIACSLIGAGVAVAAVGLLVHRRRQQSLQSDGAAKEAGGAAASGGFINQGWGALKGGVTGFRNRASGMMSGGGAARSAGHQHDLAEAAFPAGNAVSPTGIVFAAANESSNHSASSSAHNSFQMSGAGGTARSSTLITPPGASSSSGKLYPVVSTYTPTLGDELEIQPGDQVQVIVEYDDGWCQGLNLSRGNAKGVFPKHCVDMTGGAAPQPEEGPERIGGTRGARGEEGRGIPAVVWWSDERGAMGRCLPWARGTWSRFIGPSHTNQKDTACIMVIMNEAPLPTSQPHSNLNPSKGRWSRFRPRSIFLITTAWTIRIGFTTHPIQVGFRGRDISHQAMVNRTLRVHDRASHVRMRGRDGCIHRCRENTGKVIRAQSPGHPSLLQGYLIPLQEGQGLENDGVHIFPHLRLQEGTLGSLQNPRAFCLSPSISKGYHVGS